MTVVAIGSIVRTRDRSREIRPTRRRGIDNRPGGFVGSRPGYARRVQGSGAAQPGQRTNRGIHDGAQTHRRRPIPPRRLFDFRSRGGVQQVHRLGVRLEELAHDDIRIETDDLRVGADVGAPEDPRRPLRDVVPLEPFEQRALDLGLLGYRSEIDRSSFTLLAQPRAETFNHVADLCNRRPERPAALRDRGNSTWPAASDTVAALRRALLAGDLQCVRTKDTPQPAAMAPAFPAFRPPVIPSPCATRR